MKVVEQVAACLKGCEVSAGGCWRLISKTKGSCATPRRRRLQSAKSTLQNGRCVSAYAYNRHTVELAGCGRQYTTISNTITHSKKRSRVSPAQVRRGNLATDLMRLVDVVHVRRAG